PPYRTRVQPESALLHRPVNLDRVRALSHHPGADEISLLPMPHHLRAADAAKGAHGGEQINCFEYICLSLCVWTEQQVKARSEIHFQAGVVSEIAQSQVSQMHPAISVESVFVANAFHQNKPGPGKAHCGLAARRFVPTWKHAFRALVKRVPDCP